MNDWRSRFEPRSPGTPVVPPAPARDSPELENELEIDMAVYRPWILQRGRTRPALMIDLRRYEPKSGFWTGWAIAYPQLAAVEYVGERMLSLDFGSRKFIVEGEGLRELTERLQQGSVLVIQEYCPAIWAQRPEGPFVASIRRVGPAPNSTPR